MALYISIVVNSRSDKHSSIFVFYSTGIKHSLSRSFSSLQYYLGTLVYITGREVSNRFKIEGHLSSSTLFRSVEPRLATTHWREMRVDARTIR